MDKDTKKIKYFKKTDLDRKKSLAREISLWDKLLSNNGKGQTKEFNN